MLRIDDRDRVRLVTLDRPERLNAFDRALYRAVTDALSEAAERSDLAVAVLTGAGRAFSAGVDLAELVDPRPGPGDDPHPFAGFVDTLASFPKPLLAAVNGVGVGIGLTLLPYCDLVLIAKGARLRAPFAVLGVAPEAASSYLLPRAMGSQRAAHALFTAEWIDAEDAVESGLAWKACEPDELLDETLAVARRIAAMPVESLVETKRLLVAPRLEAVRAAREREDAAFARLIGTAAQVEAVTAFFEKRPPDLAEGVG
ncbi:MAG: enoyl-CoA hydratase-related protein [Acidimicrobiia bacterium]|nr:enoyl-CoA hydratase-related protein [Acidimicrobiia bacterium]